MSMKEEALKEWKKRDPYLEDLDGFERFLQEKQNKEVSNEAWKKREPYCVKKLRELVVKGVLTKEFRDIEKEPLQSWEDFHAMAERFIIIVRGHEYGEYGLGNHLGFSIGFLERIKKIVGVDLTLKFAHELWVEKIEHPEWFADWQTAIGAIGYSGDAYHLALWLALCTQLGVEAEALDVLNNLPEELRHKGIPEYATRNVEAQHWKESYRECKGCTRSTCRGCVPYTKELSLREGPSTS